MSPCISGLQLGTSTIRDLSFFLILNPKPSNILTISIFFISIPIVLDARFGSKNIFFTNIFFVA